MRFSLLVIAGVAADGVVPLPTAAQLAYQRMELVATVGYQMNSFTGTQWCGPDNWNTGVMTSKPSTFAPGPAFDVSQWADVVASFGARGAWMDTKHVCGFLLWPTSTTLPDGSPYGYDVGAPGAVGIDVVGAFKEAFEARNITPGYYYSLTYNYYANVLGDHGVVRSNATFERGMVALTQEEYDDLCLDQLRELWTKYGVGGASEVWFDGGVPTRPKAAAGLAALVSELIPDVPAFGGLGVSPNAVKWVGDESGLPSKGIWSTGTTNQGAPDDARFLPTGCDTILMTPHTWFWEPGMGVRSLAEMIDVYHATVGNNCVLELGFATDRSGAIPGDQVARAKAFGDWIRTCYGAPVNSTAGGAVVSLKIPPGRAVDRVVVQEDLANGQRVRSYVVDATVDGGKTWAQVSNGTAVGHKRIDVLGAPLEGTAVELRLTITAAVGDVAVPNFAAFAPCASA